MPLIQNLNFLSKNGRLKLEETLSLHKPANTSIELFILNEVKDMRK